MVSAIASIAAAALESAHPTRRSHVEQNKLDLLLPPPTYEESICDTPPDYTTTDKLARHCDYADVKAAFATVRTIQPKSTSPRHVISYQDDLKIDFSDPGNIRSHVSKKKAKQAAKEAQAAKWADSDQEGDKDGADGEKGGDDNGSNGGAGAGGSGGDPPGGDGDKDKDEDDWWNDGAKSKKDKKKKKKNAWYV